MYVRKFEADSVDAALQEIKHELGPDAIILKTVTNKGLKGTFKKYKIEITAAISEKKYLKKARVDNVLDDKLKDKFYQQSSEEISNVLGEYSSHVGGGSSESYGKLGLNRSVSTVQTSSIRDTDTSQENIGRKTPSLLDTFLEKNDNNTAKDKLMDDFLSGKEDEVTKVSTKEGTSKYVHTEVPDYLPMLNELERQIDDLKRELHNRDGDVGIGLSLFRASLRSFGVRESYIQKLIKKAIFELSDRELEDEGIIFDFALREMSREIKTAMPLFSQVDSDARPVITVLISDASSGQTSMMLKLGSLKKNSVLIQSCKTSGAGKELSVKFAEGLFGLQVVKTNTLAEVISECRKALIESKSVFLDLKIDSSELDETKKFIEGLSRSFEKIETLLSLSAIHSELYNRRIVRKFKSFVDGVVISHLDQCLDYGAVFNLTEDLEELPLMFYGTGKVIPDDIETATPERLMAGIFNL